MNTKKIFPLILAACVCALALTVMVLALTCGGGDTVAFTPPPFDGSAQIGTPQVPEGLGWGELDARAFRAGICGRIIPDGNTVDVYLTNPADNAVWLKLRVLDEQGNILGQTGLIRPGEYVRCVTLDPVPAVGSKITLKLMSYEPETYHSAGAASLETTVGSR